MKSLIRFLSLLYVTLHLFINTQAQQDSDTSNILILKMEDVVPSGAQLLGNIKVTDKGFKIKCSYDQTIAAAKEKARKKGANLIKITELKTPDMWSTCYRLWADVYKLDDLASVNVSSQHRIDSIVSTLIPENADYALLYVYRPSSSMGVVVQYNLHVEDSVVCRIKSGSKFIVKLTNKGNTKLWARTEGRDEVQLNIQPGKVYFLKCGVNMGAFVGRPSLALVGASPGLEEFNKIKDTRKTQSEDTVY
ncbi:DUF2846 domain-containing protein [Chitinophaga pendula]|uniref:hypothetical protein n=1 Tax=Chitinophaga TaxID=79328 RepID=UPI000BB09DD4|nr:MULTISPECIES: hypothetical protein [Chitinophaga]ASZ10746.1 hypothetical protein CK934_07010 [Chitinophaga sp. MD30]UCJ06279.1 DUF2846 domain-containing protein [Chitinophaga pendula]